MEELPNQMIDPAAASLHVLLVDANQKSRQANEKLLLGCNYMVTACKTSQEALQVIKAQQGPEGTVNFDLILKEHCPSSCTNTARFLRRAQTEQLLQGIPVIVISATEDSDLMANCLQLGAADFMLKPLRASELRNLWARVYWWRRAMYLESSNPPNHDTSGSGSDGTRELSAEPGEAAMNGVGGDSAGADRTQQDRCNDSAEPSKDSKDNLGWSGTKNIGHSKFNTQQGSNNPSNPSIPSQLDALPHQGAIPASASNRPQIGQIAGNFPGFNPNGHFDHLTANAALKAPHCIPPAGKNPSNPGFRAYVAQEQAKQGLKRALPDSGSREDPGSSGSDLTGSLEKAKENKRPMMGGGCGFGNLNGLALLTQSWLQSQQGQQGSADRPSSMLQPQPGQCQPINANPSPNEPKCIAPGRPDMQQPNQAVPSAFPFCFLPGLFGMPPAMPFMNQANGFNSASDGASASPMYLSQNTGQPASGEQDTASQQQRHAQQAMHNQIMYHHNILMQQLGIATPFMDYSAVGNAEIKPANQDLTQQSSLLVPAPAKQHDMQNSIPNSSSQVFTNGAASAPVPDRLGSGNAFYRATSGALLPQQRVADSTTDTTNRPSITAPTGGDGYMLEPSRKQRRAEALHKYKQKRKKLNFTNKIRYESRKQLAQARPRVKGQFVRIASEEVNAVVDSLSPAQMKGVAEGTIDVTEMLMENAKKAAECECGGSRLQGEDWKSVEISEETESGMMAAAEEDVSSPTSNDFQGNLFSTSKLEVPQKESNLANIQRRNSSRSGSNFEDIHQIQDLPCT